MAISAWPGVAPVERYGEESQWNKWSPAGCVRVIIICLWEGWAVQTVFDGKIGVQLKHEHKEAVQVPLSSHVK